MKIDNDKLYAYNVKSKIYIINNLKEENLEKINYNYLGDYSKKLILNQIDNFKKIK